MKKLTTLILTLIYILILVGCSDSSNKPNNSATAENTTANLSELAIDVPLNLETSSGVGVEIAFESENMLVFYGEFGLFSFDLKANEMMFSVDFVKAVGIEGNIQGSYGTAVEVSNDGTTVVISEYNAETETRGKTCYIDIPSQTYQHGEYKPLENAFSKDNINGLIYPGTKISQIKYILDESEYDLFESTDSNLLN